MLRFFGPVTIIVSSSVSYRSSLQNHILARSIRLSKRAMASQPLTAEKCEPCTASLRAMSEDEAKQMVSSLKGKWTLSPQPKTLLSSTAVHPDALHRTYKFKNFTSAQAFANQLGELAEAQGHHPAIMVECGRVTVWWWSHAINGVCTSGVLQTQTLATDLATYSFILKQLHKNDFVMAAKTEELVQQAQGYTPPKPEF